MLKPYSWEKLLCQPTVHIPVDPLQHNLLVNNYTVSLTTRQQEFPVKKALINKQRTRHKQPKEQENKKQYNIGKKRLENNTVELRRGWIMTKQKIKITEQRPITNRD